MENYELLKQSEIFIVGLQKALKKAIEKGKQLEGVIKEQEIKIEEQDQQLVTWNRVIQSDDEFDMGSIAKTLNYENFGRNKLFSFLRSNKILGQNNHPYQSYVDNGCFRIIEENWTDTYGGEHIY